MSANIYGSTISMTRSDTLNVILKLKFSDGRDYVYTEGDSCYFAVKRTYDSGEPYLIHKEIDLLTGLLHLDPSDTQNIPYGDYKYDIQITLNDGTVDTVIPRATFTLLEEVN